MRHPAPITASMRKTYRLRNRDRKRAMFTRQTASGPRARAATCERVRADIFLHSVSLYLIHCRYLSYLHSSDTNNSQLSDESRYAATLTPAGHNNCDFTHTTDIANVSNNIYAHTHTT